MRGIDMKVREYRSSKGVDTRKVEIERERERERERSSSVFVLIFILLHFYLDFHVYYFTGGEMGHVCVQPTFTRFGLGEDRDPAHYGVLAQIAGPPITVPGRSSGPRAKSPTPRSNRVSIRFDRNRIDRFGQIEIESEKSIDFSILDRASFINL